VVKLLERISIFVTSLSLGGRITGSLHYCVCLHTVDRLIEVVFVLILFPVNVNKYGLRPGSDTAWFRVY